MLCLLLCAVSVALQFGANDNPRIRQRRLVAGSIRGSSVSVREPLRMRSAATLRSTAIITAGLDAPELRAFGGFLAAAFTASSQFRDAASLGRAPPRAV